MNHLEIHRFTWTDVKSEGSSKERIALNHIKEAIPTKFVAYFNKDWNTEVISDEISVELGAVLCQSNTRDKNDIRIVCFVSRVLSDVEMLQSVWKRDTWRVKSFERYWLYLFENQQFLTKCLQSNGFNRKTMNSLRKIFLMNWEGIIVEYIAILFKNIYLYFNSYGSAIHRISFGKHGNFSYFVNLSKIKRSISTKLYTVCREFFSQSVFTISKKSERDIKSY